MYTNKTCAYKCIVLSVCVYAYACMCAHHPPCADVCAQSAQGGCVPKRSLSIVTALDNSTTKTPNNRVSIVLMLIPAKYSASFHMTECFLALKTEYSPPQKPALAQESACFFLYLGWCHRPVTLYSIMNILWGFAHMSDDTIAGKWRDSNGMQCLRFGKKECPSCRMPCANKRQLVH